jgi:putative PIN family toxin of toxin-antitoxin system
MLVAVIDTNVWISAFLTPHGHPAQIYAAAQSQIFFPVTSEPLLAELAEVLSRPRLMKVHGESLPEIEKFVAELKRLAILVPITGSLALCRDPDDDVLLKTALAGRAPYIVSRDEDLTRDLDLYEAARRLGVQIATVAQFLKRLT